MQTLLSSAFRDGYTARCDDAAWVSAWVGAAATVFDVEQMQATSADATARVARMLDEMGGRLTALGLGGEVARLRELVSEPTDD
jgi:hypothetical protein